MTLFQLTAIGGVALLVISMGVVATDPDRRIKSIWMAPALLAIAFLAWSIWTVAAEGPLGFWDEHIRSFWGVQIWLDLLLAIGIGWALIAGQAKALGMRLAPWMIFILSTGCIGFLIMMARFLYLKEKARG